MKIDIESKTEDLIETAGEREAHYFLGTKLEPYSFCRRSAVWRVVGDGLSTLEIYAVIIFACMKSREELDRVRTDEQRSEFRKQVEQWADEVGPEFEEAVQKVGSEILKEMNASAFKLKPKTDQRRADVPGNE
jgi:hypothetical protein